MGNELSATVPPGFGTGGRGPDVLFLEAVASPGAFRGVGRAFFVMRSFRSGRPGFRCGGTKPVWTGGVRLRPPFRIVRPRPVLAGSSVVSQSGPLRLLQSTNRARTRGRSHTSPWPRLFVMVPAGGIGVAPYVECEQIRNFSRSACRYCSPSSRFRPTPVQSPARPGESGRRDSAPRTRTTRRTVRGSPQPVPRARRS